VVDDTEPEVESDLRRRAAWLLVMLAVVAVLFIVVVTALVSTDSSSQDNGGPGPLDSAINSSSAHPSSTHHKPARTSTHPRTSSSAAPPIGRTSCPTSQTCILEGDIGNGIQAINDYRTQHGQPAVQGEVSLEAQTCAVHNGNGCSGGWAETELSTADGAEAVHKILQFGKLLDPNLKTFEVGWAYDPGAKLYYFAIIRND
jgi:hypothetical protein